MNCGPIFEACPPSHFAIAHLCRPRECAVSFTGTQTQMSLHNLRRTGKALLEIRDVLEI